VSRRQGTKKLINEETPLTPKEELFVQHYIETANGEQSAIYAGYSPKTARAQGSRLLTRVNVAYQIKTRMESMSKDSIAKAEEVMEYFTKVMRGEIQDQFGLDASLAERTKAAQELAKRTIDIENKLNAKGDTVVEVNLNWERTRNTTVTVREQQVAETETSVEEDNEGEDIYDG
jgi:phage terminase small subunit